MHLFVFLTLVICSPISLALQTYNSVSEQSAASYPAPNRTQPLEESLGRFSNVYLTSAFSNSFTLQQRGCVLFLSSCNEKHDVQFSQLGIHKTDQQWAIQWGYGKRYWIDPHRVGFNLFIDRGFPTQHMRIGGGLEYHHKNLIFTTNSYYAVSKWKYTSKVAHYTRPAIGYDVKLNWLCPLSLHWGGSIMYESYCGNHIALLPNAQQKYAKNPHSCTFTMHYTPIPLLTLEARYSLETQLARKVGLVINLNYQLGAPWQKQCDPNQVATQRNLANCSAGQVERSREIIFNHAEEEKEASHFWTQGWKEAQEQHRQQKLQNAYDLLGTIHTTDEQTIKKNYKERMLKNHPDKQIDPAEKQSATKRAQEINNAYDLIKQDRNFN